MNAAYRVDGIVEFGSNLRFEAYFPEDKNNLADEFADRFHSAFGIDLEPMDYRLEKELERLEVTDIEELSDNQMLEITNDCWCDEMSDEATSAFNAITDNQEVAA